MNILFIHQSFPGQFKHFAPALVAGGHDVRALVINPNLLVDFLTALPLWSR